MDEFDPRQPMIGKGLRSEESKIFFKHGLGKSACKCCQISSPMNKCHQELNYGMKRTGIIGNCHEKGKAVKIQC